MHWMKEDFPYHYLPRNHGKINVGTLKKSCDYAVDERFLPCVDFGRERNPALFERKRITPLLDTIENALGLTEPQNACAFQ